MFSAQRTPLGILAGFAGVALTIAIIFFHPVAEATDGIDTLITGSIDPAPAAAPTQGSTDFRKALALLASGDEAGAYTLGAALPDALERRTIEWGAIYYGGGAVPYDAVLAFLDDAPAFAATGVFKTRLEQALLKAKAPDAAIIKYLAGATPNTLDAQIALAVAYVDNGEKARAARIARSIWVDQVLDPQNEKKVLAALGKLLTPADHWARAENLMMDDRASAVERLLPFMSPGQKSLAIARNAVSRNAKNAKQLLDAVVPAYRDNPIYYFSRAQRARGAELWDDAIAYLNKGQANDPNPEDWWYERRTLVRQLLGIGDPKRAYAAAAGYTSGPEGRLVEARFHAGWIALSFLDDAKSAAKHFEKMASLSSLPESVTQADYWLGRALDKLGDKKGATAAYTHAAKYGTIYYGILARNKLGLKPVELRALPAFKDNEAAFNDREVIRAVRLLAANGQGEMAAPLLSNYAQSLKSGGDLLLAARLAQTIDSHNLAILIADIADRRGSPLDLFSFPKDGLPTQQLAQIDPAAVYAITRQESHFKVDAVSKSGAQGLMQLMPATAKETAKKVGVAYSKDKLASDASYNALLGSTYLASQLSAFDGSLVLAAAAYNAGAGNARKWIAAYGDPRQTNVDPVVWVELIPFEETRKYVQRVLGNYLVYRARLGQDQMDVAQVLRSISG